MLASFFSWFGVELLKSILFMIGLIILIPFLIIVLIFFVAWLNDQPLFRQLFFKKGGEEKSQSINHRHDTTTLEEPGIFAPTREWRAKNYVSGRVSTSKTASSVHR